MGVAKTLPLLENKGTDAAALDAVGVVASVGWLLAAMC